MSVITAQSTAGSDSGGSGSGTVTSVNVTGSTGIATSGGPITTSGTINLTLATPLQQLAGVSTNGYLVRTGSSTTTRSIVGTAGHITVTNGDGTVGNTALSLPNVGTPLASSFVRVSTDAQGRVTAGDPVSSGDIDDLVGSFYVSRFGSTMNNGANLTFTGGGQVLGLPAIPSTSTAAASKAYVDSVAQGLTPKETVRAATVVAGDINTSYAAGAVIDGYTLVLGDRILLKNQALAAENGIYNVSVGSPIRANDMDMWSEVPGSIVVVQLGTTNADTGWVCTSDDNGTLDTTPINWVQFFGVGEYTVGTGLTLVGRQFSLATPVAIANGGTGLSATPITGQILLGGAGVWNLGQFANGAGINVGVAGSTVTIANTGVTSLVAGTGISLSGSTGAVTVSATGAPAPQLYAESVGSGVVPAVATSLINSVAVGDFSTSTGLSSAAIGYGSNAGGSYSLALSSGYNGARTQHQRSIAMGHGAITRSNDSLAFAMGNFGSVMGSAQRTTYIQRALTTTNTPVNVSVYAGVNIQIVARSASIFETFVIARRNTSDDIHVAGYKIEGIVAASVNPSSDAVFIGTPTITTFHETDPPWNITPVIVGGTLDFELTGDAVGTISWVVTTQMHEVVDT